MKQARLPTPLEKAFPPSPPCSCDICRGYCRRPGWWTVAEAARAMKAGYAGRMMLEVSGDMTFGVLSPAFSGCGGNFALKEYARRGCCFLQDGLCELHGTGLQPLECRYCHHDRKGLGIKCHAAIEQDWHTARGRQLVKDWTARTGLWQRYGMPVQRIP